MADAAKPAAGKEPPPQAQQEPPAPKPVWKRVLLAFWDFLGEHWFIFGLAFAIGFAAAVPNLGRNGGWIAAQWTIKYGAVIVVFILSGFSLKTRVLWQAAARAHVHLFCQVLSLGLTPLIGFGIYKALKTASWMDPNLASGLAVATSMPTTISTNVVFTKQAAGNEAMALINAVIGNIIGIFVSPGLLTLYINMSGQAPYQTVLQNMAVTIIAPLVFGQLCQFFMPKAVAWLQARVNFSKVSNVMILLLVWNTFCGTFYSNAHAENAGSVVLIVFLCMSLYIVFTALCFASGMLIASTPWLQRWFKVTRSDVVAMMYIGATKTLALGMPLISVLYKDSDSIALLALPLIIFHASQTFQGNFLIKPFKNWVNKEQKLPTSSSDLKAGASGISTVAPGDAAGGKSESSPPPSPTIKAPPPAQALEVAAAAASSPARDQEAAQPETPVAQGTAATGLAPAGSDGTPSAPPPPLVVEMDVADDDDDDSSLGVVVLPLPPAQARQQQ